MSNKKRSNLAEASGESDFIDRAVGRPVSKGAKIAMASVAGAVVGAAAASLANSEKVRRTSRKVGRKIKDFVETSQDTLTGPAVRHIVETGVGSVLGSVLPESMHGRAGDSDRGSTQTSSRLDRTESRSQRSGDDDDHRRATRSSKRAKGKRKSGKGKKRSKR
jgi:hypothetical protein